MLGTVRFAATPLGRTTEDEREADDEDLAAMLRTPYPADSETDEEEREPMEQEAPGADPLAAQALVGPGCAPTPTFAMPGAVEGPAAGQPTPTFGIPAAQAAAPAKALTPVVVRKSLAPHPLTPSRQVVLEEEEQVHTAAAAAMSWGSSAVD